MCAACTDPTSLGAGLLEQDAATIERIDTLTLLTSTVPSDPVRTHADPAAVFIFLPEMLFGEMDEPVFGKATAEIYTQVRLQRSESGNVIFPDFSGNIVVDSFVLVLPYNLNGFYGNTEGQFGIEVFRMEEAIDPTQTYFDDASFAVNPMPIGSRLFTPGSDSLLVLDYNTPGRVDTLQFAHLRVPLDPGFAQEILQADSLSFTSDSLLQEFIKGLYLRPSTTNEEVMSFSVSSSRTGMILYYTQNDTLQRQYQFQTNGGRRVASLIHDYENAIAGEYISDGGQMDSLVFVQGMAGLNLEVRIPHIRDLEGVIVNKAELELAIAELPEDMQDVYTFTDQLIVTYRDEEDQLILIDDIRFLTREPGFPSAVGFDQGALIGTVLPSPVFDGQVQLDGDTGPARIRFNISAHLQRMIEGQVPDQFTISVQPTSANAQRIVLYGGAHSQYPATLTLALTKP